VESTALGRSGLRVTRMMFGGAPIGGLFAPVTEQAARATLEAAWAAGVRAFDTAPHYGAGLSEQRLGAFLAGLPRQEYVLCTKVGRLLVPAGRDVEGADGFYGTPRLRRVRDYSRDGVRASLEASLRRLGTDRVDVALIHDPDDHAEQALAEAYPALAELRAEGVIGAIGVGMNQTAMLKWFAERADLDCVLVAGRYSLLDASAADSLLPACQERGVAVLAGGVFNSGILADPVKGAGEALRGAGEAGAGTGGAETGEAGAGEREAGWRATYDYRPARAEVVERAGRLRAVCARYGLPLAAVALRFALRHPAVTAAVVGARSAEEIRADAGYLAADVPDELFAELAEAGLIPAGAATSGSPASGAAGAGTAAAGQPPP
jgi:D-threo-aldose 1-dehydrogenase